jgi:hypothetical protein
MLITSDLVELESRRSWRCVYGEIHADFPLEEADFAGHWEPRLLQESTEEDAEVNGVDIKEVKFDLVLWALRGTGEVDC